MQDEKATNDAVATGVGPVLFWPSLFFIKGDGQTAAESGRLRGEFDAIECLGTGTADYARRSITFSAKLASVPAWAASGSTCCGIALAMP